MGLDSGCSIHSSCLSGGFHLPSLVAVLCSAVAVSQGCPECLRDTSGGPSLRNTSSSTGDLISSQCSDYEQPGKPPAIDCPEVPSLHHVEVRVVAGHFFHIGATCSFCQTYLHCNTEITSQLCSRSLVQPLQKTLQYFFSKTFPDQVPQDYRGCLQSYSYISY